eukprot:1259198-Prymnesium_polylepis.3
MLRRPVQRAAGDQALLAVDARPTHALGAAARAGQVTRDALVGLSVAVPLAVVVCLSAASVQHDDQRMHRTRQTDMHVAQHSHARRRSSCRPRQSLHGRFHLGDALRIKFTSRGAQLQSNDVRTLLLVDSLVMLPLSCLPAPLTHDVGRVPRYSIDLAALSLKARLPGGIVSLTDAMRHLVRSCVLLKQSMDHVSVGRTAAVLDYALVMPSHVPHVSVCFDRDCCSMCADGELQASIKENPAREVCFALCLLRATEGSQEQLAAACLSFLRVYGSLIDAQTASASSVAMPMSKHDLVDKMHDLIDKIDSQ